MKMAAARFVAHEAHKSCSELRRCPCVLMNRCTRQVDFEEFHKLTKSIGMNIDEKELELHFEEIDIDGSGGVDFDEFYTFYRTKQVKLIALQLVTGVYAL